MAEGKVTIEQKDNGKWACFLHLPPHNGNHFAAFDGE